MNIIGALQGMSRDINTDQVHITFSIDNEECLRDINELKNSKLSIKVEEYKKKRSLDANGLLWHCLGKIATSMTPPADKWDIYLLMLKRYGKYTYICVKPNMVEAMKQQWRECEVVGEIDINGKQAVQMLCYFGSSTLNTKEFSVLLEGVISEMREMGLTTPTSKEMKRALESLEKKANKNG